MEEKFLRAVLFSGVEKKEYEMALPKIVSVNRTTVQIISSLATVLIAVMFVSSTFVSGVHMNRAVYLVGTIVSLMVFVLSITLAKKHPNLVMILVYISYSIYYVYGILIGTVTSPEHKTVTFIVMLVFIPALFVTRPLPSITVTTAHIIAFIVLCLRHKTGEVLSNDIYDALIFGYLGMASGVILNRMKVRGYVNEVKLDISNHKLLEANAKLRSASRTDLLTNIQNRNAYEKDLYKVAGRCAEALGCVYIDVNGLKYYNDNFGHEEGDKMLKLVATELVACFSIDFTYRIGGDEFVVFVPDPEYLEISTKTNAFIAKIEEMNYHAAVGWKIHNLDDLSMKDLVEEAERFMFEKKVEFYKKADFDRRKH